MAQDRWDTETQRRRDLLGVSRAGAGIGPGLGKSTPLSHPPKRPSCPVSLRRLPRLRDPSSVPTVNGDSAVSTITLGQRGGQARGAPQRDASSVSGRTRAGRTGGEGTQSCSACGHPLAHSPPRSPSPTGHRLSHPACSSRLSGPWGDRASPGLLRSTLTPHPLGKDGLPRCRPTATSVQRLSPWAEESRPAPPQLPALLSCLHPICCFSPVNLMGCHVTCELQGTGVSAVCFPPPRAQTRPIRASGPSPALRGRGASHTRCRQDPGRLRVLPACGDRSHKRPGPRDPGGCRGSCGKGDRKPSVHVSRVTWMEPGLWG